MLLAQSDGTKAKITVCFRADGDSSIGLGHVVRSKALANVLEENGVNVIWASCGGVDGMPNAVEKLYQREMRDGLDLKLSPGSDCDENQAKQVGSWVRKSKAAWIVVDHYKVDDSYLIHMGNAMRLDDDGQAETKVMIMDDHQFRFRQCHMRLAPMQIFETSKFPQDTNVVSLVGPQYLLLRPDFAAVAAKSSNATKQRSGTIVCFGGADTLGMTYKCIEMLLEAEGDFFNKRRDEKLYVLASDKMSQAQNLDHLIEKWANKYGVGAVERKSWVDASSMAELLDSCSYAFVSSSGVAVETVAMKCPCTAVYWIDNQIHHAKIIKGLGGGYVAKNVEEMILQLTGKYTAEESTDKELDDMLKGSTIDPYGAWRVASKMLNKDLAPHQA